MMKTILLTNDDGINSSGIKAAEQALKDLGELWIIAPDTQKSATGRGLTATHPVNLAKISERKYAITGTPADAVFLARNELFKKIDLVVSGINYGANLGIDIIMHSGTCGAAFEAASFGIPSIAIGLELKTAMEAIQEKHGGDFSECKKILSKTAAKILEKGLPGDIAMLNINIPYSKPRGIEIAKLGKQYMRETVQKLSDTKYFLGGEIEPEEVPGTDIYALHHERKITITPITLKGFDMNMQTMKKFMEGLK